MKNCSCTIAQWEVHGGRKDVGVPQNPIVCGSFVYLKQRTHPKYLGAGIQSFGTRKTLEVYLLSQQSVRNRYTNMKRLQRGVDGSWRRVVQPNISNSQDIDTLITSITAVLLFFGPVLLVQMLAGPGSRSRAALGRCTRSGTALFQMEMMRCRVLLKPWLTQNGTKTMNRGKKVGEEVA